MSNPYAPTPPGPPAAQPPQPAPQWAAPAAPYQYPVAPGRGGNGMAVAAVVMSGLALVGVIVLGLLHLTQASGLGGPVGVLHGTVAVAGGQVGGGELASTLRGIVTDDGGDVESLTCPATSAVGAGEVTVCHGDVSGEEWAFIVVFEDASGTFVVNPI